MNDSALLYFSARIPSRRRRTARSFRCRVWYSPRTSVGSASRRASASLEPLRPISPPSLSEIRPTWCRANDAIDTRNNNESRSRREQEIAYGHVESGDDGYVISNTTLFLRFFNLHNSYNHFYTSTKSKEEYQKAPSFHKWTRNAHKISMEIRGVRL
jgi:hypothetical protein